MSSPAGAWAGTPSPPQPPHAAANFGRDIEDRETRYARAHEVIQIVQALWGSWQEDAWIANKTTRQFSDLSKIAPINLQGTYASSRGPLEVPPSAQGRPSSPIPAQARTESPWQAGMQTSSSGRSSPSTTHGASATPCVEPRKRPAAPPDSIKFFAGINLTIAATHAEALTRRGRLVEPDIIQQSHYLGQLLGLQLGPDRLDTPLRADELSRARPNPGDPRSHTAFKIAREGWTVREVLHHAVIDYHPAPIGPPDVTADHIQEWFEAEAADGFWVNPDIFADGMDAFVDGVIPILQQRGLFRTDYEGTTLRHHLGADPLYGVR